MIFETKKPPNKQKPRNLRTLEPFVFSSKGVPSTPQHTDSPRTGAGVPRLDLQGKSILHVWGDTIRKRKVMATKIPINQNTKQVNIARFSFAPTRHLIIVLARAHRVVWGFLFWCHRCAVPLCRFIAQARGFQMYRGHWLIHCKFVEDTNRYRRYRLIDLLPLVCS